MTKAFITGVAGFIGSHLADFLLDKGYEVTGIDNFTTGKKENIEHLEDNKSFTFVEGDIRDSAILEGLISACDHVYHLGAAVGVKYIMENPLSSIEVNVKGSTNVFKLANQYKKKVYFASSSEVYGRAERAYLKETDDSCLGPSSIIRWSYGCTKLLSEFSANAYYREHKQPIVIGRFFNICGPRQSDAYGMVIPRFVKSSLKGDPITVYGDGSQIRSFTYVTDAVRAITGLMENEKITNGVYNVGNPESVTILKLAEMVKELTNSKSEISFVSFEKVYGEGFQDMFYRVPHIAKIKEAIGFEPKVNLREMISNTINYWKGESK